MEKVHSGMEFCVILCKQPTETKKKQSGNHP